jgi:hypothetical protein
MPRAIILYETDSLNQSPLTESENLSLLFSFTDKPNSLVVRRGRSPSDYSVITVYVSQPFLTKNENLLLLPLLLIRLGA